jgi:hypothetical protein
LHRNDRDGPLELHEQITVTDRTKLTSNLPSGNTLYQHPGCDWSCSTAVFPIIESPSSPPSVQRSETLTDLTKVSVGYSPLHLSDTSRCGVVSMSFIDNRDIVVSAPGKDT